MSYKLGAKTLGLWEQTVCEIRGEIKAQESPALMFAKELCDKLENSMVHIAKGEEAKAQYQIFED